MEGQFQLDIPAFLGGGGGGFEDKLPPLALPVRHFRVDATNHYSVSSDVINDGSHFGSEMQ